MGKAVSVELGRDWVFQTPCCSFDLLWAQQAQCVLKGSTRGRVGAQIQPEGTKPNGSHIRFLGCLAKHPELGGSVISGGLARRTMFSGGSKENFCHHRGWR